MVAAVSPVRTANGGFAAADPLAVLLLGPTGSGKTALSLSLARRFGGEIVSCDSVAVYRCRSWARPNLQKKTGSGCRIT
jgi:tRNA dimethylallyltransferase